MRLLVLGATGPLGARVVQEAKHRGHAMRVLVRDRRRLREPEGLDVVEGDATDPAALRDALVDVDAVVSALGPGHSWKARRTSTVMADSARALVPAMMEAHVTRLICISALGVGPTRADLPAWLRPVYRVLIRQPTRDKERAEEQLARSSLDWTLVCPTILTDKEGRGTYRAGAHLKVKAFPTIARADVARLMLDLAESGEGSHGRVEVTGT